MKEAQQKNYKDLFESLLNCLETIDFSTKELTFEETYRKGIEHIQKFL